MYARFLQKRLLQTPLKQFSKLPSKTVSAETPKQPSWIESIEKNAYLDYKPYPNQIAHNDPKSKAYIPSERDDYKLKTQTDAYNSIVTQLKNDIKLQKKIYETLETMDRPYLNGIPGVHKNVFPDGPKNYNPPENLGLQGVKEPVDQDLEMLSRNQDRFLNQTVYYPKYEKMTHFDVTWTKELETRPVNPDFHPDKGFKYDVPVPFNEKWPHVADRMGYPEILGDPWERLLRLEGDIYHPNYLDQAFVQIPNPHPNPSLNFEEGEVIYENPQLLEWAKFFTLTGFSVFAFLGAFVPYSLFYKTHLFMSSAMDNVYFPNHGFSMFYWDNLGLHIPIFAGAAGYLLFGAFNLVNTIMKDYVVKMQYSKDKELIFVTRISPYGSADEEVYETAHLECLPPSVKAGLPHMSFQDSEGIIDVTCMNTQKILALYNEDKYWNPALKQEFMQKTFGLWKDYSQPITHQEIVERRNEEVVALRLGLGENLKKIS